MRFTVMLLLLLTAQSIGAKDKYEVIESLEDQEHNGLVYYHQRKYQQAFDTLKETAIRGFKDSQYTMVLSI